MVSAAVTSAASAHEASRRVYIPRHGCSLISLSEAGDILESSIDPSSVVSPAERDHHDPRFGNDFADCQWENPSSNSASDYESLWYGIEPAGDSKLSFWPHSRHQTISLQGVKVGLSLDVATPSADGGSNTYAQFHAFIGRYQLYGSINANSEIDPTLVDRGVQKLATLVIKRVLTPPRGQPT